MLPNPASNDVHYVRAAHAIFPGKQCERFAIGRAMAYCLYLLRRKFGFVIGFPLHASVTISALLEHVGNIVFVCAKKQVSRINAGWIVAMMEYMHPFWNRAMLQFVTKAMRSAHAIWRAKITIPARGSSGLPLPTVIGAKHVYFGVESLSGCSGYTTGRDSMRLHQKLTFLVSRHGTLAMSPWHFYWRTTRVLYHEYTLLGSLSPC
jgi:hypothetical protein